MILVDTSVLIDYLKGTENKFVSLFDEIIEKHIPFGICEFIYLEVLQGSKTTNEFTTLKEYFETIPFYSLNSGKESYEQAAHMNFTCRKSGVTIRSTIDLLIAQITIENNLYLLHNDNDFTNIAKVVSALKIYDEQVTSNL
jgi:predicted nucleic acid-binding protein